jgi:hypothetical protein
MGIQVNLKASLRQPPLFPGAPSRAHCHPTAIHLNRVTPCQMTTSLVKPDILLWGKRMALVTQINDAIDRLQPHWIYHNNERSAQLSRAVASLTSQPLYWMGAKPNGSEKPPTLMAVFWDPSQATPPDMLFTSGKLNRIGENAIEHFQLKRQHYCYQNGTLTLTTGHNKHSNSPDVLVLPNPASGKRPYIKTLTKRTDGQTQFEDGAFVYCDP